MELHKIEILLEKYFQAETTVSEELELRNYFASNDVAQHLLMYKSMFCYFTQASQEQPAHPIPLKTKKQYVAWLSIAASVVVLLGVAIFSYMNQQPQDLGTYSDPELAFEETQKALDLLSGNVNKGLATVQYVDEFEQAKNRIFEVVQPESNPN